MSDLTFGRVNWLAQRLRPQRRLNIVDVGANPLGAPVYAPLLRAELAEVWAFEPGDAARSRIEQGNPALHVLDAAVGDGREVEFHDYPESEMSSIYPLSAAAIGYLGHFRRHLGTESRRHMPTRRLDGIEGLPAPDLLKVDAQGAELSVILGAGDRLATTSAVIVEMRFYRLYEGEPEMWELDRALRERGFVLHRFLHQKSRMLGNSQRARLNVRTVASQLIDGDAVYIRNLEDRDAIGEDALVRLALLAAGVFGSEDLVLWCLDELAARGRLQKDVVRSYAAFLPQARPD